MKLQGGRLEIRCCCNPDRLYGTLALNGEPRLGQRLRFTLPPRRISERVDDVGTVTAGGEVLLSVDRITVPRTDGVRYPDPLRDFEAYWALKYEGDDLEFVEKLALLVHVPGFEPSAEARALLPDPERA